MDLLTAAHFLFPVTIIVCAVTGFVMGRRMDPLLLPVAAVIAIVVLRAFSKSWREVGFVAGLAIVTHVAAGGVASAFPDNSWDGLAYQQEGACGSQMAGIH